MLDIYIVNLESSKDRREYMISQLLEANVDINKTHFFQAIDGRKHPAHPLFSKYNKKVHLIRKGRTLGVEELGCWASHYLLWEECLKLNKPIIVLEDDIILTSSFNSFWNLSQNISDKYNFLWLHDVSYSKSDLGCYKIEKFDINFNIIFNKKPYSGSLGYLLTPAAARILLKTLDTWIHPVDTSMARFWENALTNKVIRPFPVKILEDQFISTIEPSKKYIKITFKRKLSREYYNVVDSIKRYIFNFKNSKK
ncbi:MAG: glycosyltransferase family 25 protein [Psittacicella sp.]